MNETVVNELTLDSCLLSASEPPPDLCRLRLDIFGSNRSLSSANIHVSMRPAQSGQEESIFIFRVQGALREHTESFQEH